MDTGIIAAEADGLVESLLGDATVAAGGGGGRLGAAEVHFGNEAGGSAAGEVGGERGRRGSGDIRRRGSGVVEGELGLEGVGMGDRASVGIAEVVGVVLVGFRGGQGAAGRRSRRGHPDPLRDE